MRAFLLGLGLLFAASGSPVSAQPVIGFTGSMGVGDSDGGKLALIGSWEYRSGTRAYSVRGSGFVEPLGDSAFEMAAMGGLAQGEGVGAGWLVAGPSLFVYEENESCFLSGLFGGGSCTPSSTYSYHPGLAVGAGATFSKLGPLGLGAYLFGNLNLKAPTAGATLLFSISGDPGGPRGPALPSE